MSVHELPTALAASAHQNCKDHVPRVLKLPNFVTPEGENCSESYQKPSSRLTSSDSTDKVPVGQRTLFR